MPSSVFADPTGRNYPCHTKAACWNSAAEFAAAEVREPLVELRLREKAHVLGIGGHVNELLTMPKTAAAGDAFALTLDGVGHYPLRTPAEIKTAAAYLIKYAAEFDGDQQQQFAANVIVQGEKFGVETPELEKFAGLGTTPLSWIREGLTARANVLQGRGSEHAKTAATILSDLAKDLSVSPSAAQRLKLAALVGDVDRDFELTHLYDREFSSPADMFHGVTKTATERLIRECIELVDGSIVEKSALARVTEDQCRSWLGDDIADAAFEDFAGFSTEKLAEILPTLPRPEARRLHEMLKA